MKGVYVLGLLLVVLTAAAGLLFFLLARKSDPNPDWEYIARFAWQRLSEDPLAMLAVIIAPFAALSFAYYAYGARNRQRVTLTETGIEYRSAFAGSLNIMQRDWSLQWAEVQRAQVSRLFPLTGAHLTALTLDNGVRLRRLLLYPWVDPTHYRPRALRAEMHHLSRLQRGATLEGITDSPLLSFIAQRVPQLRVEMNVEGSTAYPLEKNPTAVVFAIGFFLLTFYAIGDTFFGLDETYAARAYYELYAIVGALCAGFAYIALRNADVPKFERSVVSILVGVAAACAMYPLLLRLNQYTDNGGIHPSAYRIGADSAFLPLAPGLPVLRFDRYRDLWVRCSPATPFEFELRRGGLGFHQIGKSSIRRAVRSVHDGKVCRQRPANLR